MQKNPPVTLSVPLKEELEMQAGERPPHLDVTIKSDIMQSFEPAATIGNGGDILALKSPREGLLTFSIGEDKRLHMIRKDEDHTAFWSSTDISRGLFRMLADAGLSDNAGIAAFNAVHDAGARLAVICSIHDPGKSGQHAIWVTESLNIGKPDETEWKPLPVLHGRKTELLRIVPTPEAVRADANDNFRYISCARRDGNKFIDCFLYVPVENRWKYLQPSKDTERIMDIRFGQTPYLGMGVYLLYEFRGKGRFEFFEFNEQENHVALSSPRLGSLSQGPVNAAAFIVDTITSGPDEGMTEVYLADKVAEGRFAVRYLDVDSQANATDDHDKSWKKLGMDAAGTPEAILFTRNETGRLDIFIHTSEENGRLMHMFRNELTQKWLPAYTLEKGIRRIAPASNAQGRICEIFALGDDSSEVAYLWHDEKHYSWGRDSVKVAASDNAVPVRTAQTRITFDDPATGNPVNFRCFENPGEIVLQASMACSLSINNRKYVLNADTPVSLDPKEMLDGIELVVTVSEADTPFFTLGADFFRDGKITFYPVNKVKEDIKGLSVDGVRSPKDRYGFPLSSSLVTGDQAKPEYLREVLPGLKEVAELKPKGSEANDLTLLAEVPDAKAMAREGIWFHSGSNAFDARLDLSHLPDGHMFAIDFTGSTPVFMGHEACVAGGLSGLQPPEGADPAGFWDDLAKFFGPVVEAIRNSAEKVTKFIAVKVAEGLQFTVHFLGEAFNCLVKNIEQAVKTINVVLKKYLGIDLEKILGWLGYIFDVHDIRKTQNELSKLMKAGLSRIGDLMEAARETVVSQIEELQRGLTEGVKLFEAAGLRKALEAGDTETVRRIFLEKGVTLRGDVSYRIQEKGPRWLLRDEQQTYIIRTGEPRDEVRASINVPNEMQNTTPRAATDRGLAASGQHLGRNPEERARNQQAVREREKDARHDPVLHWIGSVIKQLPTLGISNIIDFDLGAELGEKLKRFFEEQIREPLEARADAVVAKTDGFVELLQKKDLRFSDIMEYVSRNLLDLGLSLAKDIVSAVLTVIRETNDLFAKIFAAELKIPVMRELFKLVCPGVEFSALNLVSLMVAVPTTVMIKLAGFRPTAQEEGTLDMPLFLKLVIGWSFVVLTILSNLVTLAGIALNWLSKPGVDDPPPIKIMKGIFVSLGYFFSVASSSIMVATTVTDFSEPADPLEAWSKQIWIAYVTGKVIDNIVEGFILVAHVKWGIKVPAAIGVIRALLMGCYFAVVQIGLCVVRMIIWIRKKDAWKSVETMLYMTQNLAAIASRVARNFGNVIPTEGKPAIAKAICHGVALAASSSVAFPVQLTRTIGNTVWESGQALSVQAA